MSALRRQKPALLPLYSQPILHTKAAITTLLPAGKAKEEGAHQEGAKRAQVTINEQLHCVSTVINPMLLKVQSMGVHKSTKGNGVIDGGSKAGFLYRHLEGVNRGPLAIGDHRGLPDTIQGGANAG